MFILVFAAIPSFPEIPSGASWVRWRKETCRNFKEKIHCFANYCQGYFRLVELACKNSRFFRLFFKKLEKVSARAGQLLFVYCRKLCPLIFVLHTGGCGAMYEIFVESEDFRGKRQVQQHRLVNQVSQHL